MSNVGEFLRDRDSSLERERKIRCRLFKSSIKREIRHFHVVVLWRRQRNVQKSVMHVQTCCFPFKAPSTRIRILLKPRTLFCTNLSSVHTKPVNPHAETGYFLKPLSRVDFLDPTGLLNSCGRLKPDIFEVSFVINLGP